MGYSGEIATMSEYCCRIERAKNGYTVSMRDPKVVAENNRPKKSNEPSSWRDPNVEYVFKDIEGVLKFLKANLDKALPMDEFGSTFDTEASKPMKD
jgi:hypothetical protein